MQRTLLRALLLLVLNAVRNKRLLTDLLGYNLLLRR